MTDLTLRRTLGRPLEWEEMDVNMENLDSDSPWNVASGHIWYSGKVSLYGADATYDLDFTDGVANVATIGTQNADLEVHVDGARKFKIITNTQNRFQVTTDGKVGINIDSDPTYELDVDGNIRARTTLFANQAHANSFYDGTATLSGGSLTNAVNGEFTGQVRFGSLYDITNDHIVRELDVTSLTDNEDRIPTSEVLYAVDSDRKADLDSEHAWANNYISNIDSESIVRDDSLQQMLVDLSFWDSVGPDDIKYNKSGNVGIGTNPNNAKLEVVASSGEIFRADASGGAYRIVATQTGVNMNGNVGIGTTSPDEKLVVDGGVKIRGTNKLSFTNTSDQTYIHGAASNQLAFGTDSTERMRIDANGNVGIGETNPTGTALQIRRSGAAGVVLKETGVAQFYVEQDTDAKIRWTNSNNLIFSGGADGTTERMRIDADGKVGIGTTPSYTLDVKAVGSSFAPVRFSGHSGSLKAFLYTDTAYWSIGDQETHGAGNAWGGNKTSNYIHAYTNGTERMRIDADGLVGIGGVPGSGAGTLGGGTAKLQVDGDAYFSNALTVPKIYRPLYCGLAFSDTSGQLHYTPVDGTGSALTDTIDLGSATYKYRRGYFSSQVTVDTTAITPYRFFDTLRNVGIVLGTTPDLLPADGNGTASTGIVSLGRSGYKWKDAFFSGTVNAVTISSNNLLSTTSGRAGLQFGTGSIIYAADYLGTSTNGVASFGDSSYKFKDAHFSGTVNAQTAQINGYVYRSNNSGFAFGVNAIQPVSSSNSLSDGVVDIGEDSRRFKDAHFSGKVTGNWFDTNLGITSSLVSTGLQFTSSAILPVEESFTQRDAEIDLGNATARFKDAHFSGTVNGGFVSTNYIHGTSSGRAGFIFAGSGLIYPSDHNGAGTNGVASLGTISYKFKEAYVSGVVNAGSFVKTGGTSSQFLMADGSTSTESSISAGSLANSFTVQGTSFNGSSAQSVTFTGSTGVDVTGTAITATTATAGTRGSIKIGYAANGKNYPVELSSEKAFVNVPWTDTTYTAGTGLSLVGTEFRNAAPDQTVVFTNGTGISVTGTYPNFTVTNTAPDQTVALSGSGGITISGTYPNFTVTNSAPDQTVSITGSGSTTVTGTYPNFTITSTDTDNDTQYTAGTGLTLVGTEFRNAAPDQTVSLSGTGGIAITGTYPNFTIDASGAQGATYTAGNGLQLTGDEFSMTGNYTGTFTATGDVVAYSDIALKEDINPISAALQKVSQLTGYTFRRKGEEKVSTGVMAQEVQKVLPEAVHDNEGTLGVAYGNMVGLLIEAVKELSGKVESLESELNRTK